VKSLVVAALCLLVSPSASAAMKNEAEVESLVSGFMALLQNARTNDAFDLLMRHWQDTDKSEHETLKKQIAEAAKVNTTRFGKIVGYEKVKSCRVGKFLFKAQAVLKYERGFVFWNFTFYNPGSGWVVDEYRFDNKNFVPLTDACRFE
jgi:hypothetical protein